MSPKWLCDRADFDAVHRFVTNPAHMGDPLPGDLAEALDLCMDYGYAADFLEFTPDFADWTHDELFDLLYDLANVTDEPITEAVVLAFRLLNSQLTPPVYDYPRSKPITLRIT